MDESPKSAAAPGSGLREAAVRVERGVERYAEGRYEAAIAEFEAALGLAPAHARAIECLAWAREVANGRRTLKSGAYDAVVVSAEVADQPVAPVITSAPVEGTVPPSTATPEELHAPTGRTLQGLHSAEVVASSPPPGKAQYEEAPDSVTREWSTVATGANLPPLDVPELSEEQIANLLEAGGGRGLTLRKGNEAAPTPDAPAPNGDRVEDQDSDDDQDQTHVRIARVVELVAEAEDPTPEPGSAPRGVASPAAAEALEAAADPLLRPLEVGASIPATVPGPDPVERNDQSSEDAMSEPTNPFVKKRLHEFAPSLMPAAEGSGLHNLPPVPAVDASSTPGGPAVTPPPAVSWSQVRAALDRGAAQEAFDAAERAMTAPGGAELARAPAEQELLRRIYEAVVGDLRAVPRFGKATPDLDSRSAFLLSRMDGEISADDLVDVSGMPRLEALRVLAQLVRARVVTMKK